MTDGIIPESDRKGRAVCQSWLPGGKHNVTPTDKNFRQMRVTLGNSLPPPFWEGRRPPISPKENSLNKEA